MPWQPVTSDIWLVLDYGAIIRNYVGKADQFFAEGHPQTAVAIWMELAKLFVPQKLAGPGNSHQVTQIRLKCSRHFTQLTSPVAPTHPNTSSDGARQAVRAPGARRATSWTT